MKIKILIITLLLLIICNGFSQKKEIQIINNKITIGKYVTDNFEVKGLELIFPDRIYEAFIDTATNLLTIQLRGVKNNERYKNNGTIIQYDTENKKILWTKKIRYKTSDIMQYSKTIIYTFYDMTCGLDIYSGNIIWDAANKISYIDMIENVGIGYRTYSSDTQTNSSDILEGIDLKTGKRLWKRVLNANYGWNDLFSTNDSTLIIVADGLHAINLRTGKGWDYHTPTHEKKFINMTGYYFLTGIVSNALIDSTSIYLASSTQIAKINKQNGEVVWKQNLPDNMASKSALFGNDTTIYMINFGYAYWGSRPLICGKPFIAAFDRETGELSYFVSAENQDMVILSSTKLEDELYLVFKNKMVKHNLKTGEFVSEKVFQTDSLGILKYFASNRVFINDENNKLLSLWEYDSTKLYVFTQKDKLLTINDQLDITAITEFQDIYLYYLRSSDYRFFINEEKTLIANNDWKKIAEVELFSKAFIIDDILYGIKGRRFITLDLKGIRKPSRLQE